MSELSQSLSAAGAFACLLIAAHVLWRGRASAAYVLLATFFFLFGLQLTLLAVHVPTEIAFLVRIRALLALVLIPNGYLFVCAMRQTPFRWRAIDLVHALPACGGAVAIAAGRADALDAIIPTTEFAYATAAARFIPLGAAQFAGSKPHQKAGFSWLVALPALYLTMGLADIGILVDLARGGAVADSYTLAAGLLAVSGFVGYALLGALAQPFFAEVRHSEASAPRYARSTLNSESRAQVARRVQAMLDDPSLLHDEGLTVARLARRMTLPARHVTEAVNAELDCSFSDLLNERRIEAAKALLRSADHAGTSVLEVAQTVGYASKSNFNREFLRRTGATPSAYRRSARANGAGANGEIARPQS